MVGAEAGAQGRRRTAARDGRRPRGRSDRLAPARGVAAEGAVRRMVFHEITKDAIQRALGETREIDQRLVDAQETRRILDRLYGYEVSPVLWKKVMQGLSAGRVQSVAVRLVVERERERRCVRRGRLLGHRRALRPGLVRGPARRSRRQAGRAGSRLRSGRDAKGETSHASTRQRPASLAAELDGAAFAVRSADEKPYTRRPAAPFMTSTLQQEASRKLRCSAQTTMRVAQKLYENGYITYMRTDSTTLSESALAAARRQGSNCTGRIRSRSSRALRAQGEERAGSPRGDPPGRRRLPDAEGPRARAEP